MAKESFPGSDADLSALVLLEFNRMKARSLQHFIAQVVRERIMSMINDILAEHAIDIRTIVETEILAAAAQMAGPPNSPP